MPRITFSRFSFWLAYRRGFTPWDTGISPPELVAVVEGDQALPPGKALDLGCGTGTNSIYLAQHGWDVSGVDLPLARWSVPARKRRMPGCKSSSTEGM